MKKLAEVGGGGWSLWGFFFMFLIWSVDFIILALDGFNSTPRFAVGTQHKVKKRLVLKY